MAAAPAWKQAVTPREWAWPRDHGRHEGFKTEWWYFTGTCRDDAGHRMGYELTFFRSALDPRRPTSRPSAWATSDLFIEHVAVTDVDGHDFAYAERVERGRPGLAWAAAISLDVAVVNGSAKQAEDGTIRLSAKETGLSLDLMLTGGRGPVLQGPGGVNVKGSSAGQASYYYSVTRLKTTGTIGIRGKTFHVTDGLTWMDHEFSTDSLAADQIGWDWFGLQLADGTDLMVYRMRNRDGGTDHLSGTRIGTDGQPHYLSREAIGLVGDQPWTSPSSKGTYPHRWRITVGGKTWTVTPLLAGQELNTSASTNVIYWEGAVDVTDDAGQPAGAGYMELTGYAGSVKGTK